jgi:hypothetical protein
MGLIAVTTHPCSVSISDSRNNADYKEHGTQSRLRLMKRIITPNASDETTVDASVYQFLSSIKLHL